jgi:hypothetical protein
MPVDAGTDPYAALLAHAELELELVGRGELDAVAALAPRWGELVAMLPERAPEGATDELARALLVHERTRIELLRGSDAVRRELADIRRARAAARGYGRRAHVGRAVERSA